jgi:hypothetical protein
MFQREEEEKRKRDGKENGRLREMENKMKDKK